MATFRQRKNSTNWNVEVMVKGKRRSATFDNKSLARKWARKMESSTSLPDNTTDTLRTAIDLYMDEFTPLKKSAKWERSRFKFLKTFPIVDVKVADLEDTHFYAFQDARKKGGAANDTISRDMSQFSAVMSKTVKWKWIDKNPILAMDKIPADPHRERRVSNEELRRLHDALGYEGGKPKNNWEKVAVMISIAVVTGMRLGEICRMQPHHCNFEEKFVTLEVTKNGKPRNVPLSVEAIRLMRLANLPFGMQSSAVTKVFIGARERAGIENVRFHDLRHEACTRMGRIEGLTMLDMAKIIGHSDPKMLLKYFNPTATELAGLLG